MRDRKLMSIVICDSTDMNCILALIPFLLLLNQVCMYVDRASLQVSKTQLQPRPSNPTAPQLVQYTPSHAKQYSPIIPNRPIDSTSNHT